MTGASGPVKLAKKDGSTKPATAPAAKPAAAKVSCYPNAFVRSTNVFAANHDSIQKEKVTPPAKAAAPKAKKAAAPKKTAAKAKKAPAAKKAAAPKPKANTASKRKTPTAV